MPLLLLGTGFAPLIVGLDGTAGRGVLSPRVLGFGPGGGGALPEFPCAAFLEDLAPFPSFRLPFDFTALESPAISCLIPSRTR